jgi:hypothetical protein
MFIAVTTIATLLNPLKNKSEVHTKPSPFISLVYLSAFMMHFGAQMWMTFVSGKILKKSLFLLNNIRAHVTCMGFII